jgi:DNA-binding response OmpR family regulator
MKILIIEDEPELVDSIISYLKNEGFLCEYARNFNSASEKISMYFYNIILIDLNLPDGSGFNLIKKLKSTNYKGGIIITSARNTVEDRIKGLEMGADDYLTKPFHLSELNARIKSLIRRVSFQGESVITIENIKIKTDEHQVLIDDQLLDLTKKEYDLLLFLITNKNKVLSKEAIAEHLWGDYADSADSIDFVYSHIKNIRKKFQDKGTVNYLQTIYGVGYKFVIN